MQAETRRFCSQESYQPAVELPLLCNGKSQLLVGSNNTQPEGEDVRGGVEEFCSHFYLLFPLVEPEGTNSEFRDTAVRGG